MQDVSVLSLKSHDSVVAPLNQINLNNTERFALSKEPIAMQIQLHIQNARSVIDPQTQETTNYSATQVLEYFEYIIQYGPDALNAYLGHKERQLLAFRCAQVIQYYGVANVVDYIELIYGRKMKVFGKVAAK